MSYVGEIPAVALQDATDWLYREVSQVLCKHLGELPAEGKTILSWADETTKATICTQRKTTSPRWWSYLGCARRPSRTPARQPARPAARPPARELR